MVNDETLKSKFSSFVLDISEMNQKHKQLLNNENCNIIRSAVVILQPGEEVGSHNTHQHEEMLVILNGQGRVECENTEPKQVKCDNIVYIPAFHQHNVTNVGSEPLKYIYIVVKL